MTTRPTVKLCGTCRAWKPADAKHFHRHRKHKDGLQYQCKPCQRAACADNYNQRKQAQNRAGDDQTTHGTWRYRRSGLNASNGLKSSLKGKP